MARRPRPLLRFLLPLLLLLVGAAGLVAWRVAIYYERFLQASLPQWVSGASGGLYRITAGRVRVGVLGRRITLTDVHLWPDRTRLVQLQAAGQGPRLLIELRVPELRLRGVVWEHLLTRQTLHCKSLSVTAPQLAVQEGTDTARLPTSASTSQARLQALDIENVAVSGARLQYHSQQPRWQGFLTSRDGTVSVEALHVRLPAPQRPGRASGRLRVALGRTQYHVTPGRRVTTIDSLSWQPGSTLLRLSGVQFAPRYPATDQRPDIRMRIASVAAQGFHLRDLLRHRRLVLAHLEFTGPLITAVIDRRLPGRPASLAAPYPQELLRHLPVPLSVPEVVLRDGAIVYQDISRRTRRPGTLTFKSLNGTLQGLDRGDTARIALSTRFQERSLLRVQAKLPLRDPTCSFTLTGSLNDLKAYQIREPAEALALVSIQDLEVQDIDFSQTGDIHSTTTRLTGRYDDLRVNVLKADSITGALRKRGLASLFANRVVLHPSNPLPGRPLRSATNQLPRDSVQSFFNTLWSGLFLGIRQVVIADQAVLDRAQQKARTRGERLEERAQRRKQRRARRAARLARQPGQQ